MSYRYICIKAIRYEKFYLIILLAILSAASYAQEHMTFKGIEIDGPPSEMMKKLESAGFTYKKEESTADAPMFIGEFGGYEAHVTFLVNSENNVSAICVIYMAGLHSWELLLQRFDHLETKLTKKYGKPFDVEKTVDTEYFQLQSIRDGESTWEVTWNTSTGMDNKNILVDMQ